MAWPRIFVGAILLCVACGDDGGGDGDGSSDGSSQATSATGATSDPNTGPSDPGTTGTTGLGADSGSTSTGSAPSESSESSGGSSSTGGGGGIVTLQNDSWEDGAAASFQGGFVQNECWASVYVPEPDHYPFEIRGVQMIVGGEDMGEADFELALWEVDADNRPMTEIDAGVAPLSGKDDGWDGLIVEALMIDPPTITDGNFAWVVCLVDHSGPPAIASDDDGVNENLNWIYTDAGEWVQSSSFGVSGDWIMRATIEIEPM